MQRLHDLLLVEHDAVSLFKDFLQLGMGVGNFFLAVVAGDERIDVLHRTGAVERQDRNDVLKGPRLQPSQNALHAFAFKLENADRVAPADEFESLSVV